MAFYAPAASAPGGIECSSCPYVCTSVDQVKIFVQRRISRTIDGQQVDISYEEVSL